MIVCGIHIIRNIWKPSGSGDFLKSYTKGASGRQSPLRIKQHKITGSSLARRTSFGQNPPIDLNEPFAGSLRPGSQDRSNNHPQRELDIQLFYTIDLWTGYSAIGINRMYPSGAYVGKSWIG